MWGESVSVDLIVGVTAVVGRNGRMLRAQDAPGITVYQWC